jgi:hypothetical protein
MKVTVSLLALTLLTFSAANASEMKNENPAIFLEGQKEITSLTEMEKLGLNSGKTELDLWSGSYWPIYQGLIAVRFQDPEFITLMKKEVQWNKHKDLHDKLPAYSYTGRENLLSPAEKYDLLVGDSEMSLTKYSWELGEKNSNFGIVKTWRGLCDGWASAAQKMPRPVRSVTLDTPSGASVTFSPEDIKALGSLMYARSQAPVTMIGKRCISAALGLFSDACDETNPGTLHRAIVNRVGNLKKSFIADVSPGNQVWNYPVESYFVTFYNIFDQTESKTFEEVKELFTKDRNFKKKSSRHPNTHSIVGVKMAVKFRNMRDTNLLDTDSPAQDETMDMLYMYDLELDANNNIIGGESFSRNLPDFIWMPTDSTYPLSEAERTTTALNLIELSRAAAKKGQPLSRVVEKLFELAK